jgi:uncharacterized protein
VRPVAALLAALVAVLAIASPGRALEVPAQPAGRVSDYAGLLSPAARARIEGLIARHERESSDQIAVAIFRSLEGESLEDFSIRLAERWQIGSREHDNGVILLIFVEDRRTRIEVGYGLEGRLTDALSDRVLRQIIAPRFRAGDFDGGVERAVTAIIEIIRGEYQALPAEEGPGENPLRDFILLALLLFLFFGLLPALFWGRMAGRRMTGSGQGWTWGGPGGFGGGFGGGGFGGGGGGGGGGFSGGGGSFGGGGASGGW